MGWRIWPLCHCQGLCLWPPIFVFVFFKVFVYDILFASVSATDFPPTVTNRTRCLEWWKIISFLTWWLFSGGDGSRCSTTIGGCCLSGDHHYHLSAGIFIIFIFTVVLTLTLTGGGCRRKRSPCQVFQLLFQNNLFLFKCHSKSWSFVLFAIALLLTLVLAKRISQCRVEGRYQEDIFTS